MKLKYIVISLLSMSIFACESDPKTGTTSTATEAVNQVQTPKQAPQVKVNPDSPAFGKSQSAPKASTTTAQNGQKGMTEDQADSEFLAKKMAQKSRPVKTTKAPVNPNKTKGRPGSSLPSACSLVSEVFLGKLIGVDSGYISIKDGSGKSAEQSSCFFRWDHEGEANSGVLVQIQSNPLPEEFPDWASYYIAAKKNHGDKSADGSSTYRYADFKAVGVSGAASYDLGRYYWRDEKDRVFMVAFNLPSTEQQQMTWAVTIAKEVMKNAK